MMGAIDPSDARDSRPCNQDEEASEPTASAERPWLPDETTVVAEAAFTSPTGRQYRVLRTTQSDAYDSHPDELDTPDAVKAHGGRDDRDRGNASTESASASDERSGEGCQAARD